MNYNHLKTLIREEIMSVLNELDTTAFVDTAKQLKKIRFSDAIKKLYKLSKSGSLSDIQFKALIGILMDRNLGKESIDEDILTEMSVRQIKDRIRDTLKLEEVQQYKIDNFNYENIPFSIFEQNGITTFHLKQYDNSNDIVTYDLGINLNPIKKTVDVFLQKEGIFD